MARPPYVLDFASGALTRVTWSDGAESLDAWSPDGRWLYFTSAASDIGGMTDVQTVNVIGFGNSNSRSLCSAAGNVKDCGVPPSCVTTPFTL